MEPEETIVKCNMSGIEKQMLRFHSSFLFVTNKPGTFYAAKYGLDPPTSISYVLGLQVYITVDVPGLSPRGSQMTTLWLVMASTLPAELHSASFGNLINTALRSLHIVIHGPQLCWRFQSMYGFPPVATCHITVTAYPSGNLLSHCCGPLPPDLWGKHTDVWSSPLWSGWVMTFSTSGPNVLQENLNSCVWAMVTQICKIFFLPHFHLSSGRVPCQPEDLNANIKNLCLFNVYLMSPPHVSRFLLLWKIVQFLDSKEIYLIFF